MSLVAAGTVATERYLPITKSELRIMRFKKYLGFRKLCPEKEVLNNLERS